MNYKTKGKFYNPLIEKEKISMIIVIPNPNTIVQNRMIRDGVDKSFAVTETKKELEKLRGAFPAVTLR